MGIPYGTVYLFYNCFEDVSIYFKPLKERQNDLCIRIIKYIGKDITEQKEKEEWRSIKTEILKKYGNSVYYQGLVLFLYGEDHEKKVCGSCRAVPGKHNSACPSGPAVHHRPCNGLPVAGRLGADLLCRRQSVLGQKDPGSKSSSVASRGRDLEHLFIDDFC